MYQLKGLALKYKGHTNFEERCDLTKKYTSVHSLIKKKNYPRGLVMIYIAKLILLLPPVNLNHVQMW